MTWLGKPGGTTIAAAQARLAMHHRSVQNHRGTMHESAPVQNHSGATEALGMPNCPGAWGAWAVCLRDVWLPQMFCLAGI